MQAPTAFQSYLRNLPQGDSLWLLTSELYKRVSPFWQQTPEWWVLSLHIDVQGKPQILLFAEADPLRVAAPPHAPIYNHRGEIVYQLESQSYRHSISVAQVGSFLSASYSPFLVEESIRNAQSPNIDSYFARATRARGLWTDQQPTELLLIKPNVFETTDSTAKAGILQQLLSSILVENASWQIRTDSSGLRLIGQPWQQKEKAVENSSATAEIAALFQSVPTDFSYILKIDRAIESRFSEEVLPKAAPLAIPEAAVKNIQLLKDALGSGIYYGSGKYKFIVAPIKQPTLLHEYQQQQFTKLVPQWRVATGAFPDALFERSFGFSDTTYCKQLGNYLLLSDHLPLLAAVKARARGESFSFKELLQPPEAIALFQTALQKQIKNTPALNGLGAIGLAEHQLSFHFSNLPARAAFSAVERSFARWHPERLTNLLQLPNGWLVQQQNGLSIYYNSVGNKVWTKTLPLLRAGEAKNVLTSTGKQVLATGGKGLFWLTDKGVQQARQLPKPAEHIQIVQLGQKQRIIVSLSGSGLLMLNEKGEALSPWNPLFTPEQAGPVYAFGHNGSYGLATVTETGRLLMFNQWGRSLPDFPLQLPRASKGTLLFSNEVAAFTFIEEKGQLIQLDFSGDIVQREQLVERPNISTKLRLVQSATDTSRVYTWQEANRLTVLNQRKAKLFAVEGISNAEVGFYRFSNLPDLYLINGDGYARLFLANGNELTTEPVRSDGQAHLRYNSASNTIMLATIAENGLLVHQLGQEL